MTADLRLFPKTIERSVGVTYARDLPAFTLFLCGSRGKPAKEPSCFCQGMVAESHGSPTPFASESFANQGGLMG